MADASTSGRVSTGLSGVVERASRDPDYQFYSVAHLIDEQALERAAPQPKAAHENAKRDRKDCTHARCKSSKPN